MSASSRYLSALPAPMPPHGPEIRVMRKSCRPSQAPDQWCSAIIIGDSPLAARLKSGTIPSCATPLKPARAPSPDCSRGICRGICPARARPRVLRPRGRMDRTRQRTHSGAGNPGARGRCAGRRCWANPTTTPITIAGSCNTLAALAALRPKIVLGFEMFRAGCRLCSTAGSRASSARQSFSRHPIGRRCGIRSRFLSAAVSFCTHEPHADGGAQRGARLGAHGSARKAWPQSRLKSAKASPTRRRQAKLIWRACSAPTRSIRKKRLPPGAQRPGISPLRRSATGLGSGDGTGARARRGAQPGLRWSSA